MAVRIVYRKTTLRLESGAEGLAHPRNGTDDPKASLVTNLGGG
jgi:hypothetical protein